jgi:hypothetical protein
VLITSTLNWRYWSERNSMSLAARSSCCAVALAAKLDWA